MARPNFSGLAGKGSGSLSGRTSSFGGVGKNNSPKASTHKTIGKRQG